MAESYFQHAEHYFRILNAMAQAAQQNQQNGPPQFQRRPYNGEEAGPQAAAEQEQEEDEQAAPGTGDQPESREIPIAAAPPEG